MNRRIFIVGCAALVLWVHTAMAGATEDIWVDGIGNGLRKDVHSVGFVVGAGLGGANWGSQESHNLAWVGGRFSWIVSRVLAEDTWLRGNVELAAELFGGAQFYPHGHYLVGATPFLLYDFATGTRWMPFLGAGAGVTCTDIGLPDLSTHFQFNDQFVAGTHYFFDEHIATTLQYRFVHLSNAGIREPNRGVNTHMLFAGVTWFF